MPTLGCAPYPVFLGVALRAHAGRGPDFVAVAAAALAGLGLAAVAFSGAGTRLAAN